jgi:hypothetical protein
LGPTEPPIQWVPGSLFPGVNRLGREADHSSPSRVVKNCRAIPPLPHTSSWRGVQLSTGTTLSLPYLTIIFLNCINQLVFTMDTQHVSCETESEFLKLLFSRKSCSKENKFGPSDRQTNQGKLSILDPGLMPHGVTTAAGLQTTPAVSRAEMFTGIVINSRAQDPSCETDVRSADQHMSLFCGTRTFITVFTTVR